MIEQLRKELAADEGCVKKIYLDHLGKKTVGIGHLCQEGDPEFWKSIGTEVAQDRVDELFGKDIAWTMADCRDIVPKFDDMPREVRLILANMIFNMGRSRIIGFRKMLAAVDERDWSVAADEMHDSKWRRQVPARAERLIKRMRAVE
jgi:lysozyme